MLSLKKIFELVAGTNLQDAHELPVSEGNGAGQTKKYNIGQIKAYIWDYIQTQIDGITQGPQGPQGATGAQGIQGPQGVKGDKGDKGDTGLKGDVGPAGAQGIQGPIGAKGDTGNTGPQGVQGFKGDKGDKGDQGDMGLPGADAERFTGYVYADKYEDSYTGFDEVSGWNEGSAILQAIKEANEFGGGTIFLSEKKYEPIGADFYNPLTFPNIKIIGAKTPYFNANATALDGGTIIKGPFVWVVEGGQALQVFDLGVDAGKGVCDQYFAGVAQDAICWAKPMSHDINSPYSSNAIANNIIAICYNVAALAHAFLFEGIDGGVATNITTMYGVHGFVNKSKNTQIDNLRCYKHGGEGLIIKSDNYAISENVKIGNVNVDNSNSPNGISPHDLGISFEYGVLFDSQTDSIGNISIDNLHVLGGTNGICFSTSNGHNLSVVNIKNAYIDYCGFGVRYRGASAIKRTSIVELTCVNIAATVIISNSSYNDPYVNNEIVYLKTATRLDLPKPKAVDLSAGFELKIYNCLFNDIDIAYNITGGSRLFVDYENIFGYLQKLQSGSFLPVYNHGINKIEPSDGMLDIVGKIRKTGSELHGNHVSINRDIDTGDILDSSKQAYQFNHVGSVDEAQDEVILQTFRANGSNITPRMFGWKASGATFLSELLIENVIEEPSTPANGVILFVQDGILKAKNEAGAISVI